ncbi:MAG: DUF362 domain-containing protein [Candidatus Omnitrophota bacterium]
MRSKVFYVRVSEQDSEEIIRQKFARLLAVCNIAEGVKKGEKAVIKMHFGEEGNTGYVKPEYVRVLSDILSRNCAKVLVSDTNTLYKGRRTRSEDHVKLAREHGFTFENTGAEVFVPEDSSETTVRIEVDQEFVKTAKVAGIFLDAGILINLAHFKGHIMTGFGGALKNIGMGCASREGKMEQHTDISPTVFLDKCTGCGACGEVCPVAAIEINEGKASLDSERCIGCASCIAACPTEAMAMDWPRGGDTIQQKMMEYVKAVLDNRKGKSVHINFALKITKECDCLAKDDPRLVPDVGIFVSRDPVSIDKACLDLAISNAGGVDIFRQAHPGVDAMKQLLYAARLGLGNLEYDLVEIK